MVLFPLSSARSIRIRQKVKVVIVGLDDIGLLGEIVAAISCKWLSVGQIVQPESLMPQL